MDTRHEEKPQHGKMVVSDEEVDLGGKPVACRVFTWVLPGSDNTRPVRFIGPRTDDPHRQRFLPEPVERFLAAQEPRNKFGEEAKETAERDLEQFFDVALETGYRLLQVPDFQWLRRPHGPGPGSPEPDKVPPRDVFVLLKALFRHRTKGTGAVRRRLDSAMELVRPARDGDAISYDAAGAESGGADDSAGPPELVVPGMESGAILPQGMTKRQKAVASVSEALKAAGHKCTGEASYAAEVRRYQQKVALDHAADVQATGNDPHLEIVEQLVWRTASDSFATVGAIRSTMLRREATADAVAGGMFSGDEPLSADMKRTMGDPPFLTRLCTRMLQAAKSKGAAEFDHWLAGERAQGFYRLLGPEFAEVSREEARVALRAAFRGLTWLAIQLMAKCYGAWTHRAWIDFALHGTAGRASHAENWLFQQQNYPNLALAGLPLAFLSPGQELWVREPLRAIWAQGAAAWAKWKPVADRLGAGEPVAPEEAPLPTDLSGLDGTLSDACATLLEVYAAAAHTVRRADRKTRAAARRVVSGGGSIPRPAEGEELQVGRGLLEPAGKREPRVDKDADAPGDAPLLERWTCDRCGNFYVALRQGDIRVERREQNGADEAEEIQVCVVAMECACGESWHRVETPSPV